MLQLESEINAAHREVDNLRRQLQSSRDEDKLKISQDLADKESTEEGKRSELDAIRARVHAEETGRGVGYFMLKAPIAGTVLDSNFRQELAGRSVKQNEQILRLGDKKGHWEVEMKIPQKHIGQVLQAYKTEDPNEELAVDIVLRSTPTKTYRGMLARRDIGGEAMPNRDDNNEAEPVVLAYVRIEGDDIPQASRIPHDDNFLVTGTEAVAKVRCGNHAMGYSLFYGVWEFIYEKIVFFF
jgi:hypothetical protein